ncbi:hypothetical protein TNIN_419931 [Trichonephila inaurata madagascariensis]|uniref:Uncharacterized protein n=1 Tax=Trichonephila inaurata madagascariensis TaxID=2747483 RepID=A0A8X6WZW7_9ARAC|nr:hypothetical protein TNIN_419931 [Trichonephila inaurata madagascariensis]
MVLLRFIQTDEGLFLRHGGTMRHSPDHTIGGNGNQQRRRRQSETMEVLKRCCGHILKAILTALALEYPWKIEFF